MKNKQERKLIGVDCDGTFFDSDAYPSKRTCDVVQRVVDAGHAIVAVTGRSRLTAAERLIGVAGMRYLVCSNGAYTWDTQEGAVVWETPMHQSLVNDIVSRLRAVFPDVAFGWETGKGIGFEETFKELAGGGDDLESGGNPGDPWTQGLYKLFVRRPGVYRLELQRELSAVLGDGLCEISTSGAPFVEITAEQTHKASGLSKTASMLGFTADETIVFGDNQNDLPMFGWAGHAVAMGNALDSVKARAHALTLPNIEHGVAHYLENLLAAGKL
ncbi:MAG: HAD-IIB family hydrolase [Granulosicoccus sp.]